MSTVVPTTALMVASSSLSQPAMRETRFMPKTLPRGRFYGRQHRVDSRFRSGEHLQHLRPRILLPRRQVRFQHPPSSRSLCCTAVARGSAPAVNLRSQRGSVRGSRVRVPDGPLGIPGTYAGSFAYARACGVSGRPHSDPGSLWGVARHPAQVLRGERRAALEQLPEQGSAKLQCAHRGSRVRGVGPKRTA